MSASLPRDTADRHPIPGTRGSRLRDDDEPTSKAPGASPILRTSRSGRLPDKTRTPTREVEIPRPASLASPTPSLRGVYGNAAVAVQPETGYAESQSTTCLGSNERRTRDRADSVAFTRDALRRIQRRLTLVRSARLPAASRRKCRPARSPCPTSPWSQGTAGGEGMRRYGRDANASLAPRIARTRSTLSPTTPITRSTASIPVHCR